MIFTIILMATLVPDGSTSVECAVHLVSDQS